MVATQNSQGQILLSISIRRSHTWISASAMGLHLLLILCNLQIASSGSGEPPEQHVCGRRWMSHQENINACTDGVITIVLCLFPPTFLVLHQHGNLCKLQSCGAILSELFCPTSATVVQLFWAMKGSMICAALHVLTWPWLGHSTPYSGNFQTASWQCRAALEDYSDTSTTQKLQPVQNTTARIL